MLRDCPAAHAANRPLVHHTVLRAKLQAPRLRCRRRLQRDVLPATLPPGMPLAGPPHAFAQLRAIKGVPQRQRRCAKVGDRVPETQAHHPAPGRASRYKDPMCTCHMPQLVIAICHIHQQAPAPLAAQAYRHGPSMDRLEHCCARRRTAHRRAACIPALDLPSMDHWNECDGGDWRSRGSCPDAMHQQPRRRADCDPCTCSRLAHCLAVWAWALASEQPKPQVDLRAPRDTPPSSLACSAHSLHSSVTSFKFFSTMAMWRCKS